AARRKAFAKLDADGDGRVSFEEYAVKTTGKFDKADADRSGTLTATEFATTRVARKAKAKPNCPPTQPNDDDGN
ncbi:MAG: EF-hand domain-containing protein, partial [Sphingomonas sp.]